MNKGNFSVLSWGRLSTKTSSPHGQAGFSIFELLIALMLLAIGTALSLPSYQEMIQKRQLTHGAEQIMAFVNAVQSESVKQNRIVTVSYSRTAANNWCVGAIVGATACDCAQTNVLAADYCAINTAPQIINNTNVGNTNLVTSMTGDGAYSFDPIRGIVIDLTDSLAIAMTSNSGAYLLNLSVSNAGQVVMCSTDSGHAVPGYIVCSP